MDRLHSDISGYKTDHRAFTDQCTSGGTGPYRSALVRTGQHWSVPVSTGPYILGRPVKFSNSQDADNLHTIRKRMPIPFQ